MNLLRGPPPPAPRKSINWQYSRIKY
ncbi:hypothetical protein D910_09227 [Dendroctonus ponderosae]|uniref:Uncharacterized protein n=1 Tax=Dendroctonus ponderosae TaxID=77166 RepID=U4UD69_DENPD|nr:hypothetical protein D910_09227 [Dendroctonus ponderosae]